MAKLVVTQETYEKDGKQFNFKKYAVVLSSGVKAYLKPADNTSRELLDSLSLEEVK